VEINTLKYCSSNDPRGCYLPCKPHGGYEKCAQNFVRKPEEKIPLLKSRRRWDDNIKIYLKIVCVCGLGSADSGKGTVVFYPEQGKEPLGPIKG
jgi:hypothetical protein